MSEAELMFRQNITCAAKMSTQLHSSISNHYIVASFLKACCNVEFHHHWMMGDTWSDLIYHRYMVNPALKYSGKDLVQALSLKSNVYLTNQMDMATKNVPFDHAGIFRQRHNPKIGPRTHCFYPAPPGEKPSSLSKWYLEINDAKVLISRIIT